MFKFISKLTHGNLYGFGLTEANLNRMEFNNEPIFFDFGYAGFPKLFGLILYTPEYKQPEDIAANVEAVKKLCIPFLNLEQGVTPESLHFFPLASKVVNEFRSTPFWGYSTQVEITNPADQQIFFAGRDEQSIEGYFKKSGLISPQTQRTYKGFGK
ncbi:hypothetical protein [Nostoc sp.]